MRPREPSVVVLVVLEVLLLQIVSSMLPPTSVIVWSFYFYVHRLSFLGPSTVVDRPCPGCVEGGGAHVDELK